MNPLEQAKLTCPCGATAQWESNHVSQISLETTRWLIIHREHKASSPTIAIPNQTEGASTTPAETMKAPPSAALVGLIEAPTRVSQRVRGVLTEVERTHVEWCSECWAKLVQFSSQLWTHVQDVSGSNSTSQSEASSLSVGQEPDAAPSSLSASSECKHSNLMRWTINGAQTALIRIAGPTHAMMEWCLDCGALLLPGERALIPEGRQL